MKFDITRINSGIDSTVDVNIDYKFSEEELKGTDLLECFATITGSIYKNSLQDLNILLYILFYLLIHF